MKIDKTKIMRLSIEQAGLHLMTYAIIRHTHTHMRAGTSLLAPGQECNAFEISRNKQATGYTIIPHRETISVIQL